MRAGTERSCGNDEREVVQQSVVDLGRGAGGEAKDGTGTEECGRKREEEIETKLGGVAQDVVGFEGFPSALDGDSDGNPLKIPKRTEGEAGHGVPDALLPGIGFFVESVIGADGGWRCPIAFAL
jgi:hypothetical protein